MGGEDSESALANRVDARCGYNNLNSPFARRIVRELDALLNEHNELLKLFKSHMPKLLGAETKKNVSSKDYSAMIDD
ncbi:uncharacterized protein CEXT_258791 [Caerostris extrusa]|uniref:Uncharacterized protein n=1 Tax=Caerostris extrusa TaxID=172846 RepID=A0AAV4VL14_CAEEX|nr:uncharacterized protein CEXT_258791 [Caerostris extrusa]